MCSPFATPRIVAHQASLSMRFPRQEYCSGFPFPSPGDLPDPGTELMSLVSHALAGGFFTTAPPGKHPQIWYIYLSPFSKGLSQFSMLCHSIPEFSWDRYQTTYPRKVMEYLHHNAQCFSPVWLFVTLWAIACQDCLSREFSRQEYWSGLPCLPPGESSQPRDWTHVSYVSCTGRRILYY